MFEILLSVALVALVGTGIAVRLAACSTAFEGLPRNVRDA